MTYVYYNLTNLTSAGNQTTLLTYVDGVNSMMNNVPALLILLAIYIVLLLALIGRGFNPFKTFAAVSFAILILTIILYPTGLISGFTLVLFAILCPSSIFILWVFGGETYG